MSNRTTLTGHALLLLAGILITPTLTAAGDAPDKAGVAIQKVLDDQVVAWNKGDLKGFMVGYWKSKELSFFSGNSKTFGWQATLERYEKKYQGEKKEMGTLAFKEVAIDLIGAEHALVRGRWQLTLTKESPTGLFTLLMRKMPEGWRIVHDHTSN